MTKIHPVKKFWLAILLFTPVLQSLAQFKTIAESAIFKEVESGYGKVILLKDGSTFLLTGQKGDAEIRVFDPNRKQRFVKQLSFDFPKFFTMQTLFEHNGEMVLLVKETDDKTPALIRYRIDLKQGKVTERKVLMTLDRINMRVGMAIGMGGLAEPDFFVRKDPYSECYAVAKFNTLESDRNKRLEIIHYGAGHQELSRVYYQSPNDKYKYLEYIDMAVLGQKQVSILVNAYNTRSSGGDERELLLGTLEAGTQEIVINQLEFSKDLYVNGGIVRFNPVMQRIIVVANMRERKANGYIPFMAYINPFQKKVEFTGIAFPADADESSKQLFGKKKGFTGLPQNLYIHSDGGFSIVFEEMMTYSDNRSVSTVLGNVAVGYYNMLGGSMGSFFVPKSHYQRSVYLKPFYLSRREGGFGQFAVANQYKTVSMIDGNRSVYLLVNDIESNATSIKKGKLTTISGVGDCDAYCYDLAGEKQVPERAMLFGDPGGRKNRQMAIFEVADYDRKSNIYVTLKLEKEGRDKGVKLVWMQPA